MRRSIGIAAGLLSFALLASPAAAQGKSELTVALSSFSTEVLDPVLGGHVVKYYMSLMFDYLVGVTPDGQLSKDAGLATRWEPSADHRRWTFYLRKGARFHTGDEVTSEDVKFSLQRAIGKRSTTGYAGPLRALIADIETPASDRLVIVTKEPTLIIPTYFAPSDVLDPAARGAADQGQARARGAQPRRRSQRGRAVDLRRSRRSGVRSHGALLVVSRHRLQGDARDAVSVRRGAGQETPGRRGLRRGLSPHGPCVPAPWPAGGQGVRRGDGRVLAEARRPDQADPRRLPGVSQELVRPGAAGRDGLLQHRQPRLDRHVRAPREAGLHQVEGDRP